MADNVHRASLWLFAGIALAVGCILAATTVSRLTGCRARMEKRMADYNSLAGLDTKLRHMETALATWQERTPGPPAPVSVLATNVFGDLNIEMREAASSNAAPGLLARQIEVTCQGAPFDRAMQLVQRLDGLWPRWVLVHLEIKSTDQVGRGRVLMRFESISSAAAAPAMTQLQPSEPSRATPFAAPAEPSEQHREAGKPLHAEGATTNSRTSQEGWLKNSR